MSYLKSILIKTWQLCKFLKFKLDAFGFCGGNWCSGINNQSFLVSNESSLDSYLTLKYTQVCDGVLDSDINIRYQQDMRRWDGIDQ